MMVSEILKAPVLEHESNSENCWCNPEIFQGCPACDGRGCFGCDWDGVVAVYDDKLPLIVIHNDV